MATSYSYLLFFFYKLIQKPFTENLVAAWNVVYWNSLDMDVQFLTLTHYELCHKQKNTKFHEKYKTRLQQLLNNNLMILPAYITVS